MIKDNRSWKFTPSKQQCLHEKCTSCKGTGTNKITGQPCIHMISCPCSRCSPYSLHRMY